MREGVSARSSARLEQRSFKPTVVGSNPTGHTISSETEIAPVAQPGQSACLISMRLEVQILLGAPFIVDFLLGRCKVGA